MGCLFSKPPPEPMIVAVRPVQGGYQPGLAPQTGLAPQPVLRPQSVLGPQPGQGPQPGLGPQPMIPGQPMMANQPVGSPMMAQAPMYGPAPPMYGPPPPMYGPQPMYGGYPPPRSGMGTAGAAIGGLAVGLNLQNSLQLVEVFNGKETINEAEVEQAAGFEQLQCIEEERSGVEVMLEDVTGGDGAGGNDTDIEERKGGAGTVNTADVEEKSDGAEVHTNADVAGRNSPGNEQNTHIKIEMEQKIEDTDEDGKERKDSNNDAVALAKIHVKERKDNFNDAKELRNVGNDALTTKNKVTEKSTGNEVVTLVEVDVKEKRDNNAKAGVRAKKNVGNGEGKGSRNVNAIMAIKEENSSINTKVNESQKNNSKNAPIIYGNNSGNNDEDTCNIDAKLDAILKSLNGTSSETDSKLVLLPQDNTNQIASNMTVLMQNSDIDRITEALQVAVLERNLLFESALSSIDASALTSIDVSLNSNEESVLEVEVDSNLELVEPQGPTTSIENEDAACGDIVLGEDSINLNLNLSDDSIWLSMDSEHDSSGCMSGGDCSGDVDVDILVMAED